MEDQDLAVAAGQAPQRRDQLVVFGIEYRLGPVVAAYSCATSRG